MTGRWSSDPLSGPVSGHLPSPPNSDTGGRSKLAAVALFS